MKEMFDRTFLCQNLSYSQTTNNKDNIPIKSFLVSLLQGKFTNDHRLALLHYQYICIHLHLTL